MNIRNFCLSYLFLIILIGWSGCTKDPKGIDVKNRSVSLKEGIIGDQGIRFLSDENSPIAEIENATVTNNDLFNIVDPWTYYENVDASQVDVYIDMSGGLDQGIEATQEHVKALTLAFENNATYYKVGGSDDDQGEYTPELFPVEDYLTAYNDFLASSNYTDGRSKLKAGLKACVANKDKISVFVTDFLLDEGKYEVRNSLMTNIPTRIGEDGSPWGITEFKDWFRGDNILEIISVKHNIRQGYGCHKPQGCEKQMYYLFFTPIQLAGMNEDVEDLLEKMKDFQNTTYLKIHPSSYGAKITKPKSAGDVQFSGPTVHSGYDVVMLDNYKVQFLPFSVTELINYQKDKEGFIEHETQKLIDNFELVDRANSEESPFKISIKADFYDMTDCFYELSSINKNDAVVAPFFDPDNYPFSSEGDTLFQLMPQDNTTDERKILLSINEIKEDNNLFSFSQDDYSIWLSADALAIQDYWAEHKGYGKLFLCQISVDRVDFEEYTNEELSWTFYNKYGGWLKNEALKESINMALTGTRSKNKNRIIFSYLIALNDHDSK